MDQLVRFVFGQEEVKVIYRMLQSPVSRPF